MRWLTYHIRSATYHRRTNLAVALGAAVATASLTGALMVGDSMRGSLREIAIGRLGRVDHTLVAQRFFRQALADELAVSLESQSPGGFTGVAPAILLRGGVTHADLQTRVERVNLLGVEEHFWRLDSVVRPQSVSQLSDRYVILNEPLAAELNARIGDDVLIHTSKPSAISTETLLGRRDDATATLRLAVAAILPAEGLAAFDLNPRQGTPRNAYIPLAVLQRTLGRQDVVNTILVSEKSATDAGVPAASEQVSERLQEELQHHASLVDLGLKLRVDETHHYISVDSDAVLIEPALEQAGVAAARAIGLEASPVLAHLANTIALDSKSETRASDRADANDGDTPPHVIPYSTVVAVDPQSSVMKELADAAGDKTLTLSTGEVLLNQWAADDLHARPGDRVTLTYYVSGAQGKLETRSATFALRGVVPLSGSAADPGFVPEYHGVTDAVSLADWNPPFPIDLKLIRDQDDAYWKQYRTTPKAFVSLADGQRLWATEGDRFGRITSIRLSPPNGAATAHADLRALADKFQTELLCHLNAAELGLRFQSTREQVLQAATGSTDFGVLFVSFSFFLIISAAMLVALLFRLGVERRAFEIGLLLASGFAPRKVAMVLLWDGALVAMVGGLVGVAGAFGYAWLMLAGLRSWWSDAVNTPLLRLHVEPATAAIGFVAGLFVATASIAWSVRGLTRRSARSLLDGFVGDTNLSGVAQRGRAASITAAVALAIAVILAGVAFSADTTSRVIAFFSSGSAMLVACLAVLTRRLRALPHGIIHAPGGVAVLRIGVRNAGRNPGRSLLTAGLIASAVFVIVSLEAFRLDADTGGGDKDSGTGGFSLFAESVVPLPYDIATREGREALGIADRVIDSTRGVRFVPFRLKPGDESSCLNLYRPTQPRIVGAPDEMIERGGFRFADSLAESESEKSNPWTLLRRSFADGAVAAIGDESAVRWQLHLGLDKDLVVKDERGRDVKMRFVGLLKGSILQGEVVIADAPFVRLFPSISGQAFFLIEAPTAEADEVERSLEKDLSNYGFDASSTSTRLAEYFAVQNTYISTFQTLGGLGLLLGTGGLAAVLLRNVWERRRELALMRTVGFSHAALTVMVLVENAVLLVAGVIAGLLSAALAIAPVILKNASSIPWPSLALTVGAVVVVGMLAGLAAVVPTLRAPLIPALRNE
ncbi:MAG: FtsX-like permease family protein [Phycisphaerales bacterium]|nr:FtsX-like permease family protein [Phycisphaerales bacterium]